MPEALIIDDDPGSRAELRGDGGAFQRDAGRGRERPHRVHHQGHHRARIRIGGGLGQGGEREEGFCEALDPPALLLQTGEMLPDGSLVGCERAPEELELDVDRAQGAAYLVRRRSREACEAPHAGSADIFIEWHRARDVVDGRRGHRPRWDNVLASPPAPRQCAPARGCPVVEMGRPDRVG